MPWNRCAGQAYRGWILCRRANNRVHVGVQWLPWSPDSRAIVWSDGRGMRVSDLGQPARQVAANVLAMPNDEGRGVVTHRAWSPTGRYILARIGHDEGSSQGIVDTQTGHLEVLPNSFDYAYPGPRAAWMQDGRLFVIRPGAESNNVMPSGEIWRVDSKDSALVRDLSFPIHGIVPGNDNETGALRN